jgi:hypothetical protein
LDWRSVGCRCPYGTIEDTLGGEAIERSIVSIATRRLRRHRIGRHDTTDTRANKAKPSKAKQSQAKPRILRGDNPQTTPACYNKLAYIFLELNRGIADLLCHRSHDCGGQAQDEAEPENGKALQYGDPWGSSRQQYGDFLWKCDGGRWIGDQGSR